MKAVLFLLLALGASSATACSDYYWCHCDDSDGTPNNDATTAVCSGYFSPAPPSMVNDTYDYGDSTTYLECEAHGGSNSGTWNNCVWRRHCQNVGATGDSNCHCKGNCVYNPPSS